MAIRNFLCVFGLLMLSGHAFAQRHCVTPEGYLTDSSTYVVFHETEATKWMLRGEKSFLLSFDDIHSVDSILSVSINEYNLIARRRFDSLSALRPGLKISLQYFIVDLSRYKRQYVAVFNRSGEKEVWANCFCDDHGVNWLQRYFRVRDGGNCYFRVKLNMTNRSYYDLSVNEST